MQCMRSKANNEIVCGIAFLEIHPFLENHSLEFYEICHENTFENK